MMKEKRLERSFTAKDGAGNVVTLDVYVEVWKFSTSTTPHGETQGNRSIRTRSGKDVNPCGKGEYEIVVDGVRLKSDDPDAL